MLTQTLAFKVYKSIQSPGMCFISLKIRNTLKTFKKSTQFITCRYSKYEELTSLIIMFTTSGINAINSTMVIGKMINVHFLGETKKRSDSSKMKYITQATSRIQRAGCATSSMTVEKEGVQFLWLLDVKAAVSITNFMDNLRKQRYKKEQINRQIQVTGKIQTVWK